MENNKTEQQEEQSQEEPKYIQLQFDFMKDFK